MIIRLAKMSFGKKSYTEHEAIEAEVMTVTSYYARLVGVTLSEQYTYTVSKNGLPSDLVSVYMEDGIEDVDNILKAIDGRTAVDILVDGIVGVEQLDTVLNSDELSSVEILYIQWHNVYETLTIPRTLKKCKVLDLCCESYTTNYTIVNIECNPVELKLKRCNTSRIPTSVRAAHLSVYNLTFDIDTLPNLEYLYFAPVNTTDSIPKKTTHLCLPHNFGQPIPDGLLGLSTGNNTFDYVIPSTMRAFMAGDRFDGKIAVMSKEHGRPMPLHYAENLITLKTGREWYNPLPILPKCMKYYHSSYNWIVNPVLNEGLEILICDNVVKPIIVPSTVMNFQERYGYDPNLILYHGNPQWIEHTNEINEFRTPKWLNEFDDVKVKFLLPSRLPSTRSLVDQKTAADISTTVPIAHKYTYMSPTANRIELVQKEGDYLTTDQVSDGKYVTWGNNTRDFNNIYYGLRLVKGYVHLTAGRYDNGVTRYSSNAIAEPYNTCVSYDDTSAVQQFGDAFCL